MRRGAIAALTTLALGAGLSGCGTTRSAVLADQRPARTPTEQYGLNVTSAPERLAIAVHPEGLSANQQTVLGQTISDWRDNGGGDIVVSVPTDAADPHAARAMADEAAAFLLHLGAPAANLHMTGYVAGAANAPAPILITYAKYAVVSPHCADRWDSLLANNSNQPYANFGCAVTANIGAQIANPRDLLQPQAEAPADNSRRQVVLGKYRTGTTTSTSEDSQASGKISQTQ